MFSSSVKILTIARFSKCKKLIMDVSLEGSMMFLESATTDNCLSIRNTSEFNIFPKLAANND